MGHAKTTPRKGTSNATRSRTKAPTRNATRSAPPHTPAPPPIAAAAHVSPAPLVAVPPPAPLWTVASVRALADSPEGRTLLCEAVRALRALPEGRTSLRRALGLYPEGGPPPPFVFKNGPKSDRDLPVSVTAIEMELITLKAADASLWDGRAISRTQAFRRFAWEGLAMRGFVPDGAV